MTAPAIMRHALTALVAALALTACRAQPQSGDVLLADDFSNPDSGFTRQADADAITDYHEGEYQIQVFTSNINVWSVNGQKFADVKIDVNARTAAGSENNTFGVVCRHRDDSNFYFFAISADGYYAIGKVKEGAMELISSQVYEPSDKIHTGQDLNHIAATCLGESLTLSVNDAQIAQAADPDFADGKIGLIAGTFDDPETDVRFDNLVVTKP
ncbi:MAG TPA: hypothetical protein VJ020_09095 [Anaerolineales bacterium]|nr:hypothetical protein [Anaerolineales bacterium]